MPHNRKQRQRRNSGRTIEMTSQEEREDAVQFLEDTPVSDEQEPGQAVSSLQKFAQQAGQFLFPSISAGTGGVGIPGSEQISDVAKEFTLEPFTRSIKSIQLSLLPNTVARPDKEDVLTPEEQDAFNDAQVAERLENTYVPKSGVERFLYGEEPVGSLERRTELVEEFGEDIGFDVPDTAAATLVGAGTLLDTVPFIPGGTSAKRTARGAVNLARRGQVAETFNTLRRFLDDEGVPESRAIAKRLSDEVHLGAKSRVPRSHIQNNIASQLDELAQGARFARGEARSTVPGGGTPLNLSDTQKANINNFTAQVGGRQVNTLSDVFDASADLGVDPNTLLTDFPRFNVPNEAIQAIRADVDKSADAIIENTKRATQLPQGQPRRDALDAARTAEANLDNALRRAQLPTERGGIRQVINTFTDRFTQGRNLARLRLLARKNTDNDFWYQKAVENLRNRPFTQEVKSGIDDLIQKGDPNALASFVHTLGHPTIGDRASLLLKTGFLTSPSTQLVNIGGNTTMRGLETVKDFPAVAADWALSSLRGSERTKRLGATMRGLEGELGEAMRAFDTEGATMRFLRTGENQSQALRKLEIPRNLVANSALERAYTNTIFRSLGAGDLFFRNNAYKAKMVEQAAVSGINRGLKGNALKEHIQKTVANPPDRFVAEAIDAAERSTFTQENRIADFLQETGTAAAQRLPGPLRPLGQIFGTLQLPFRRTLLNIAGEIVNQTPVGALNELWRFRSGQSGQRELAEAFGRSTTGTTAIALGALMHKLGLMTSEAPDDENERADFFAEGKQPNAVFIGGKWRRVDTAAPGGSLLAIGAALNEVHERRTATDPESALGAGLSTAGAITRGVVAQTPFSNLDGLFRALARPEDSAQTFLKYQAGSLVPSIIGRSAKSVDPNMRVPEGLLGDIQRDIPGMREEQPIRRDIFGEASRVPGGGGITQFFDPFRSSPPVDQPVLQEAKRLNLSIGLPEQTIDGHRLTDSEYSFYQKIQGRILKENLEQLVQSPRYQALPDREKRDEFEAMKRDVRREVNERVAPALFMNRFKLDPEDTNPQFLRNLMREMSQREVYQNMTDKQKGNVLRKFLREAREQQTPQQEERRTAPLGF